MHRVKTLLAPNDFEDRSHNFKHGGGVKSSIKAGSHLSVRLSQKDENDPIARRRGSTKPFTVTYQEDEKKEEQPSDSFVASKTKFKALILQKTPSGKYSMRDMENLLKEQAAQRKILEQQTAAPPPLKLNIEDRYSDEGELDIPRQFENNSVRMLDKWQLDTKKKKFASAVEEKAESIAKVIKKSVPEVGVTPNINSEIMNIIMFSDDDRENVLNFHKKRSSMDMIHKPRKPNYEISNDNLSPKGKMNIEKIIRGAETQKREANKEILQNMIFKKINDKNGKLLSGEKPEELSNEIKSLLHQNMQNFQALKGISSVNDMVSLEHMANGLLKKKMEHDKLTAFEKESTKNINHDQESKKPLMDYRLAETVILKKFNECIEEIERIRDKIVEINHESYLLRVEMKHITAEKDEVLARYDLLEEEIMNETKERTQGLGRRKAADRGNLEDYMKLQKIRADKKKQEMAYTEKLEESEKKIQKNSEDIVQQESDLRSMKQLKAHYKLQVKELYHQTLQDCHDLLNPDNATNYISVIVSAWNVHEEITENNLASFLEKETASFMIQYAKQLSELEKYCKEIGMAAAVDNFDDFKDSLKLPNINFSITAGAVDRTHLYAMNKDLSHLIKDIKDRMHLIKKREIKAIRHITLQSPHKLKDKIIKEEDVDLVDPIQLESRFSGRDLVIGGGFTNYSSRNNSVEYKDPGKNVTDQAAEMGRKLEALRRAEISRLFRVNMAKHLDDRLKENLRKVFRYAFGKKDSQELITRFMKEKRVFDQKIQKALGGNGPEKQNQSQDEKMMRMMGLKSISTTRSSLDLKVTHRSVPMNQSPLPPLDHSRSNITILKNSFASNNESTLQHQTDQINENI